MKSLVLTLIGLVSLANAQYFGDVSCRDGRDVVVHLFEWSWDSIASECSQLAQWGYCAVQVSPPQEHIQGSQWWTRYQPVSYQLNSRSGNRAAFQNMVQTCNNAGVYIYVDAVINHMTGGGSGTGSGGSSYDAGSGAYTESYPAVPYGGFDFNGNNECPTASLEIDNYQDVTQVRNCRLVGLRDLQQNEDYVRGMIQGYMNDLIGLGVAGFRIDACKHMWPGDLSNVYAGLNNLNTQWFSSGTKPFIYQEVIDQGGEPITAGEYTGMARVTEFKYGGDLSDCVQGLNNQRLAYLSNFGESWGYIPGINALSFVDNHDNQRGHGGAGDILTFKDPFDYKIANAFMLAWNYGYVRVMSSYQFYDGDQGPPGNQPGCFNGDWICEHAWRQIYNMVRFHNVVVGQGVTNWWSNGNMQISFSRGNKGFLAINKESGDLTKSFQTGLPHGEYCDVISCDNNHPPCGNSGGSCRGTVNVANDGTATITVSSSEDPMWAMHV